MRINRENTLGLIIDMQEKLLPHIHEHNEITHRSLTLVKGLRVLNVPIIVTQQYTKGLGNTMPALSESIGNFSYIEKLTFSCYRDEAFIKVVNRTGKRNLLIAGIETHICIMQTALDLIYNNFNPIVIADATSSRKGYDKEIALNRLRDAGCVITTTESVLFELCQRAGTDEFKEISKLVK
jgi:nicotinamidase-related amidase